MTRILFVIDYPFDLGAAMQLGVLLRGLNTKPFDLHVAVPTTAPDQPGFFHENATLHHCSVKGNQLQNARWLRNVVKSLQPQVIQAWGNDSHALVKVSTCMINKPRRVFTFLVKHDHQGLIQYAAAKTRWRKNDQRVVSHDSIAADLSKNGIHTNAMTIPNSISDQSHDRDQARQRLAALVGLESEPAFLVGTASHFRPSSRLKDLVWAIDLLCCVRQDIHLVIFGTGCDLDVRRYISQTVAGNNIHIVPPDLFRESDVYGLDLYWNSQLQTPNATTMLVAMAHEIPVISVLGEETADAVVPLQTVLATNFGARDEFARWTKFVIEQPDTTKQLVHQASRFIKRKFPPSATVSAYRALYS